MYVPSGRGGGVWEMSARASWVSLEEHALEKRWAESVGIGASLSDRVTSCLLAHANSDMLGDNIIIYE